MTCFTSCPPCAGCEELRRRAGAAEAALEIVRGIVAEMRADATRPKGGQTVGPRRMPVALSIILELERAMGPEQGTYTAQAYFDLTARVEALEKALREWLAALDTLRRAPGHRAGPHREPVRIAENAARAVLAEPAPAGEGENDR